MQIEMNVARHERKNKKKISDVISKAAPMKQTDFAFHILCIDRPDVWHSRNSQIDSCLFFKPVYCRNELIENKSFSLLGIDNAFPKVNRRTDASRLFVEQQSVVKRQIVKQFVLYFLEIGRILAWL